MPPIAARRATSGLFGLNGFLLGSWIVQIPLVKDRTGIDDAALGGLLLLTGLSALAGMQVAGRLIDRIGSRPTATVAMSALALVLPLVGLAESPLALAGALVVLGLSNGVVDVSQNAQAVVVERAYGRPIMAAFHAMYSLGNLAASLLGGLLISLDTSLVVTLSGAAAAGLLGVAACRRSLLPDAPAEPAEPGRPRAPWTPQVVLLGLLAFALMLSEGVAYDWSTVHLRDQLGSSETVAAWAFGSFAAAMTVVRLLADRVVARVGAAAYVSGAALVGAAAMLGVVLASSAPVAIAAWTVFGIGLAGCVPQFFSAAGNVDPAAAGTYLARVTSFGYTGLLAGPSIIGFLTHWVPLSTALVVPLVGCLVAGVLARRALAHREAA